LAQNTHRTDRLDLIRVVNVASGDDSVEIGNIRAIKADIGGVVKLQIQPYNGRAYTTVEYLPDGVWLPIGGTVKRVYRYYTGTTSTTCQVYDSTGTLVNGVKVGK
jgi:hypothetical protein